MNKKLISGNLQVFSALLIKLNVKTKHVSFHGGHKFLATIVFT